VLCLRSAAREEEVADLGPALALAVRLLVMLRSGEADSVEEVGFSEFLLKPLRPCTVGNQPSAPL
jgi:hypothetical protein